MSQNAARLNQLQIKEQQQLNRERKQQQAVEKEKQESAVQKSKAQFNHVQSHGYGKPAARGSSSAPEDDVEIKVYVRECDEDAAHHFRFLESDGVESAPPARATASKGAPSVRGAPASTAGKKSTKSAAAAPRGAAGRTSVTSDAAPTGDAPNKGKVPKYLVQRKADMAAEKEAVRDAAARKQEEAKIPPGHRLVPEEEKAATLVRLEERKKELEAELGRIPLRFDTVTIQNKRKAIENELQQIETARLKYTTKRPLYVPLY